MHIGYLMQDFPPEVGAGPARAFEMSRFWHRAGVDVTVISAMPNRRIPGRGDGVIDPRYAGKLFMRENWDGVTALRSWLYTSPRRGMAQTAINNATFTATAFAHGIARRLRVDVLIASSPPFLPLLAGVGLSRTLGCPLVVEIRDLWPDYLVQMGMLRSPGAQRALFSLERWILRRAAMVTAVTDSFRTRLIDKGVAPERAHTIPNGVDVDAYHASIEPPPLASMQRTDGEFVVGYLGTFGRGQALPVVVETAAILADVDPRIRIVLVGDGPDAPAVRRAAEQAGLTNLRVHAPIERTMTRAFYNACDACLVPLAPIPIFQETIPSKIFEVMACERPVIASLGGEGSRILRDSGGGVSVTPGDARALAAAIMAMRREPDAARRSMGRKGREYVIRHYSREALAMRYLELLRGLAGGERPRADLPPTSA